MTLQWREIQTGRRTDARLFLGGRSDRGRKRRLRILDLASHDVTFSLDPTVYGRQGGRRTANYRRMSADIFGLKVLDITTQRWSTLPVTKDMGYPAWSSDSQSIYFLRLNNGDRGVYRVRATGGKTESVVDLKTGISRDTFRFGWGWIRPTRRCCCANGKRRYLCPHAKRK